MSSDGGDLGPNLVDRFLDAAATFPQHPALEIGDRAETYETLAGMATRIAATALRHEAEPRAPHRLGPGQLVIGPETVDFGPMVRRFSQHRFVGSDAVRGADLPKHPATNPRVQTSTARTTMGPSPISYLLFTSGTIGTPKGVAVSQRNVAAYLDNALGRNPLASSDRCSQTFDLTFDLSVHDIFTTWSSGACLVPVPDRTLLAPAKFIRDQRITTWFSVPTVAMNMARLGMLEADYFPDLRLTLFCGEPLPERVAVMWTTSAPHSVVENLYGPTEATIAISTYPVASATRSVSRSGNPDATKGRGGIVPIGWLSEGQEGRLVADGEVVADVGRGELLLAGSQVTTGYFKDPEQTAARYVLFADTGKTLWYRTGDIVERRADGCLLFVGRVDRQIKLHGHRIELQEIEAILRSASGTDLVAVLPWPRDAEAIGGIVGCISAPDPFDEEEILETCRRQLPSYMVPARIFNFEQMPVNVNGKVDLSALEMELADAAGGEVLGT